MNETEAYEIDEMSLKKIHMLHGVNLDSIKGLLDLCTIKTLQPEEVLLTPEQANRAIFLLLEGRLRVHLESVDTRPIAILGPGESVGEMSVIDQQRPSAFVIADEACKFLVMDEDILWSLVQSSHEAACNLLFILVKRLRHADSVISEYDELGNQFRQHGSMDALTGLHNRYWLDNILKRLCVRSSTGSEPLSVIMIDIDHFKEFNNNYGHLYGDHVLYSVSHAISDLLRPSELVARFGDDEFIVVLPDLDINVAREIAERLHKGVMDKVPVMPDGKSVLTRLSPSALPGQTPVTRRRCSLTLSIRRCFVQRIAAGTASPSKSTQ